jgi:catechol 2,3-dioxygenase-like lactoylglutathione lyase family enzyme
MAIHGLHHIVLDVPDVGDAEAFYADLFDLAVAFREGEYGEEYGSVPDGLDWPAARERGVEPGMTFLRRDAFSLAVAETGAGGDADGRLDHAALAVDEATVRSVAERARDLGCEVDERDDVAFVTDRYGVEWELNSGSPPPTCPFDDLPVDA